MNTEQEAQRSDGGATGEQVGAQGGEGAALVLPAQLAKLAEELSGARRTLEKLELRQRVARAVESAAAVVPATVGALVEAELLRLSAGAGEEVITQVIETIRARRPWLFARGRTAARDAAEVRGVRASAMAPMQRSGAADGGDDFEAVRRRAGAGDRAALLAYLRSRRG